MNIFYLDHDPKQCATWHVDKHVVKMILEYCQLLSTAHRVLDGYQTVYFNESGRKTTDWKLKDSMLESVLYKSTHHNHPSAVWVRMSKANYEWLYSLLVELCDEYTFRYNKVHKSVSSGVVSALKKVPNNIANKQFTEPTPAMDDVFKISNSSVACYRNFYKNGKEHLHTWKNRNIPYWIT